MMLRHLAPTFHDPTMNRLTLIRTSLLSLPLFACAPTDPVAPVTEGAAEPAANEVPAAEADDFSEEVSIQERFNQRYDDVHLVVLYDPSNQAFHGTVLNVSDRKITWVEVSVRITGGEVLEPASGGPCDPGNEMDFSIQASGKSFRGFAVSREVTFAEDEE